LVASLKSFTLNPDGRLLELTFEKKVQVMRADELDSLIAQLGELRSRMQPDIPTKLTNVTAAHPVEHFYFRRMGQGAQDVPIKAGALLMFQSPRFGWFQFPASAELCAGMAKWLVTGDPEGLGARASAQ
jgi:hypothetical protein